MKKARPKPKPVKLVAAVERALGVLGTFTVDKPTLALTDIAERTGLQKSTALRLLATLERHAYIIRLHDGRYQLGVMPVHLAAIHRASFRSEEHILPALQRLSNETGESATFYIRQGDKRLCLLRVHSRHLLRDVVNEGDLLPMNETSTSQVLIGFEAKSWSETKGQPQDLVKSSSLVGDTMTASISAPVFNQAGLLGAMTISGPVGRFDFESRPTSDLLRNVVTKLNDQMTGNGIH